MEIDVILKRKKMRRCDLAKLCNLSASTVTRHLNGQSQPKIRALNEYSKVLRIPMTRLVKMFSVSIEDGQIPGEGDAVDQAVNG